MQVDTVHSVVTVSLLTKKTEPVLVGLWLHLCRVTTGARTSVCEVIVICCEQNRRQNSGRNIGKMCTAAKLEKGSEVTAQVLIL